MFKNLTVIGDGQLARMMQPAAVELGIQLRLLAGQAQSSAAQVIPNVYIGDYRNVKDCLAAARGCDAVTFDHEHVPAEVLKELLQQGHCVHPQPQALLHAQDKLVQRQRLSAIGAPVPEFAEILSVADAKAFWDKVSGHVCLKTRRGGYDGKGVWFPETLAEFEGLVTELLDSASDPESALMAEEKVSLNRELSVLVARRPSGEVKAWPVTMSVQENGVCSETIAPAPQLDPQLRDRAQQLGVSIARQLDVTGVMAVELFAFKTDEGREDIAVNELAMRPHNTGHWTQDGCLTSQFEQHLRAVLDIPLGDSKCLAPVTVMANILGAQEDPAMPMEKRLNLVAQRFPEAKIHLYGKDHKPGRKLGHVNVVGKSVETTRRTARLAAGFLVNANWEDQK